MVCYHTSIITNEINKLYVSTIPVSGSLSPEYYPLLDESMAENDEPFTIRRRSGSQTLGSLTKDGMSLQKNVRKITNCNIL